MKLIIAGSRSFNNFDFLEKEILKFLKENKQEGEEVRIISGTASGADRLGEQFASKYSLPIIRMPANWKLGKSAGYVRNSEMAKIATHCIVFWDGVSRGSKNMIETAEKTGLNPKVRIVP